MIQQLNQSGLQYLIVFCVITLLLNTNTLYDNQWLQQITPDNVKNLTPAWMISIGTLGEHEGGSPSITEGVSITMTDSVTDEDSNLADSLSWISSLDGLSGFQYNFKFFKCGNPHDHGQCNRQWWPSRGWHSYPAGKYIR